MLKKIRLLYKKAHFSKKNLHQIYVDEVENLQDDNDLGYILLQTESAFAPLEILDY